MKKKTDKGFSLIELIIAIAILIILTGFLAPQFMKYIEKSRIAACLNNIDVVVREYQVALIEDRDITPDKVLEDMVSNRGLKCPSGGMYSIVHRGEELFFVKCSKHGDGGGISSDPMIASAQTMYEQMVSFSSVGGKTLREIQELLKEAGMDKTYVSNDTIRAYLLKNEYGGNWPQADKDFLASQGYTSPLYVQPYIDMKDKDFSSVNANNVTVYIGNSSNDQNGEKWKARMIYNPEDGKWYKEPDTKSSIQIANISWDTIKKQMEEKHWAAVK